MAKQIITLVDGSQVRKGELTIVMNILRRFYDEGIVGHASLWELAQGANDTAHTYDEYVLEELQQQKLIQSNGEMHEDVRSIVKNSVLLEGDFEVAFVNPVKS